MRSVAVLVVVVLTFSLQGIVQSHLCIDDPPQRLQSGNLYDVDCYQSGNGPCGKDFPSQPSANPTVIAPGSVYPVSLNVPVQHYYRDGSPVAITFSIAKAGSDSFTQIGQGQDGPWTKKSFDIKFPTEPGNYILQAEYAPPSYDFFACSDVTISDSSVVG